jgi:hypothetical protein
MIGKAEIVVGTEVEHRPTAGRDAARLRPGDFALALEKSIRVERMKASDRSVVQSI